MDKQTAKLVASIAENLPEMDSSLMQGWIENPKGLQKTLKEALCPPVEITKMTNFITHTFMVPVDETISVEEAIKLGKFDWANDDITSKTFPKLKDGKKVDKEVAIFHFNKSISSKDAIAEMDKAGYKPATIQDLLGLSVKEPNLQRKFPIVALGSVCKLCGRRRVAYLSESGSRRRLSLDWFVEDWRARYRFAGVHK